MEDKEFDFWRDHSPKYLEMALNTEKRGILEQPDGYGTNTGECGDTVEMYLVVRNGVIQHATFDTNGCINTNACANTVSRMVEGKKVSQAWAVTPEKVIEDLETLQKENHHCAELAVGALYFFIWHCQIIGKTTGSPGRNFI
ncbi:MAG: iron-sulfur cluster assembly scaffold protein [Deltaproteobacteria bacterium]|nr:iron-sulfur cluster assembly scaffold protein [Deltaproteobacteria bacterium]